MRSYFSSKEILGAFLGLAILSVMLFPAFSAIRPADDKVMDLINLSRLNAALQSYRVDHSDKCPLAFGTGQTNNHQIGRFMYTPYDWPSVPNDLNRQMGSRFFAFNAVTPYLPPGASPGLTFAGPGAPQTDFQPDTTVAEGKSRRPTTYAYNGLLHAYPYSAVAALGKLPLVTGANGKHRMNGAGFSNPQLVCSSQGVPCNYVPTAAGCGSSNGTRSTFYSTFSSSTHYHFGQGQNWLIADGHIEYRRLNVLVDRKRTVTDFSVDPFNSYNAIGAGQSFWTDGCHPWLFRPNFGFE